MSIAPINSCSLRLPNRKQVKIRRSCPTERGRAHVERKQGKNRRISTAVVCDRLIANGSRTLGRQVKIRRSCPTEGTRARQNGRQAREAADIKVLTDLSIPHGPACYRHAGPYGPEEGCLFGCCSEQARRAIGLTVARFFLLSEAGLEDFQISLQLLKTIVKWVFNLNQ